MKLIITAALFTLSFGAFAAEEHPDHMAKMEAKIKEVPECSAIAQQCEAAGYHVGMMKEGKGLLKDCIGGIAHDKKIDKVTATKDDAKKCHEALHKMHEMHHQK